MAEADSRKMMFWNDFLRDANTIQCSPDQYVEMFGDFEDLDFRLLKGSLDFFHKKELDDIRLVDKFGVAWLTVLLRKYEQEEDFEQCIVIRDAINNWKVHY